MKKNTAEIELLKQHYHTTLEHVKDDSFYRQFADEKNCHIRQVIGAGNFIMKHEPLFCDRPQDFLNCARLGFIFHDLGRFREIRELYDIDKARKERTGWAPVLDHGEFGAEELRKIPEYNDIRIWLPVRHHGHMIERFYEDPDYQSLQNNPDLQAQTRDVIFLARDADKIANLYLLKRSGADQDHFFYETASSEFNFGPISPEIVEAFENNQVGDRKYVCSASDRILNVISWVFDLNFASSFGFINRHRCVDFLFEKIRKYNSQTDIQKKLAKIVQKYIDSTYQKLSELK